MSLEIREVNTFYGNSHILFGLSLSCAKGKLVCLLGRNGVGKTTTLRSIMGLTPPRSGSIKFKGCELVGKRPYQIAREGLGYVPAGKGIFPDLSVRENLMVGKKPSGNDMEWTVERAYELFPALKKLDRRLGGYLSGGEQQMLAVARSLMGNPEFLLLDEPVEGLAPLIVKTLEEQILNLKEKGISMLVTDHNVRFALRVSDYGYILDKGKVVFTGTPQELDEAAEADFIAIKPHSDSSASD